LVSDESPSGRPGTMAGAAAAPATRAAKSVAVKYFIVDVW